MTDQELINVIQESVAGVLDVEPAEITLETRLIGDLSAESIDMLDISSEIEKRVKKPVDFKELPVIQGVRRKDVQVSEVVQYLRSLGV
jgi:acyl carrier protein